MTIHLGRRSILLALLMLAPLASAQAAGETGAEKAREAAAALAKGDTKAAAQLYTEALADPTLPNDRRASLHSDRGLARARLNRAKAAIEDFNRAVQLFPEYSAAYNNRGNVLLSLGFVPEAVKDFNRAILLAPGYAAAYNNRASAKVRLGQIQAAVSDYTTAIKLAPTTPSALGGRGRAFLAAGRPHAAIRDFTRATERNQKFGSGYRGRAEAYMRLAQYDEAVSDLSRAAAFDPTNAELYALRGKAYLAQESWSSAVKDFDKAHELQPRTAEHLTMRGYAYAKANATGEALSDLAQAIASDPRSAVAYAYRAWVYRLTNQPELGQRDIERALQISDKLAEVHWAKGEIAEAQGNIDAAIASQQQALALEPDFKEAASALDRLGIKLPDEEAEYPDLAIEGWRVVRRKRTFIAISEKNPELTVPLEPFGDALPRLIAWDARGAAQSELGVLTFALGPETETSQKPATPQAFHEAALVDIRRAQILTIVSQRLGDDRAEWTWSDEAVNIVAADGITERIVFDAVRKRPAPETVAVRERPRRQTVEGGTPFWAPWANPGSPPGRQSRQTQQKPKTLFELLFGN